MCKRRIVVCIECAKVCLLQNQPLKLFDQGIRLQHTRSASSAGTPWRTAMPEHRALVRPTSFDAVSFTFLLPLTASFPVVSTM